MIIIITPTPTLISLMSIRFKPVCRPVRCTSFGRLGIYQTARMGQAIHRCWCSQTEFQPTRQTSSSSSADSAGSSQRWLASCAAYFILRFASGWWSCQSCGGTTSWSQTLWVPSVSMRHQGGSWRHSRPRMQMQRRQNNLTSRLTTSWTQRLPAPTFRQLRNRLTSRGLTENVQMDWCRSHGRLARLWHGTSQSSTPWLSRFYKPRRQLLESQQTAQQTERN